MNFACGYFMQLTQRKKSTDVNIWYKNVISKDTQLDYSMNNKNSNSKQENSYSKQQEGSKCTIILCLYCYKWWHILFFKLIFGILINVISILQPYLKLLTCSKANEIPSYIIYWTEKSKSNFLKQDWLEVNFTD